MNISVFKQFTEILIAPIDAAQSELSSLISNSILFTLALTRFLQITVAIFKGPESVIKGLIPVLETVQTRLVLKETSEGPKLEDLRPVSQGPRLMVSEGLGPGLRMLYTALRLRGPWPGLRKTWNRSQRALELSLRSIRSKSIFKGPGLVLEDLRQVLEGLTRTGFRGSKLASEGPGPVS